MATLTKKDLLEAIEDMPIDSFALNRRELDGRQIYCRDCQREAYRKWYRKHVKAD